MKLRSGLAAGVVAVAILAYFLIQSGGDPPVIEPGPHAGAHKDAGDPGEPPLAQEDSTRVQLEAPHEPPPSEGPQVSSKPEPPVPDPPLVAGCLRVIATRGGIGLSGHRVYVYSGSRHWLPRGLTAADPRATVLVLDAAGATEVHGLEPGEYSVGVELAPGQLPQRHVELAADVGRTVRFEFSGARLFGNVFNPRGGPATGACVSVSHMKSETLWEAWTDSVGAYNMEALQEGWHWITVRFEGSLSNSDHMLQVSLLEGEEKRLDFGSPAGLAVWRGVLRNRAGNAVPGRGLYSTTHLHFVRAEDHAYSSCMVDGAGRFEHSLAPGKYDVRADRPAHLRRVAVAQEVEVGTVDFERDLVLPGTRVMGRIFDPETGEPRTQGDGGRPLAVRARTTNSTAYHFVPVGADATYILDGLSPGIWRIGSGPRADDDVEVQVREQDYELIVNLELPR